MPRRLPVLTLTAAGLLVLFAAGRAVFGQDAKDRPVTVEVPAGEPVKVRVDLAAGGPAVEGTLDLPAVPLRVDTGTRVIDLKHVRRVTFQREPGGASQDTVELVDKEVVRGRVTAAEFTVRPADGGPSRTFKKAELQEITVLHEHARSWLAILVALVTLSVMEIVLGVDNVIFLAIEAGKLPEAEQARARQIGLAAALGTRILLLFTLSFLLGLTAPMFTLPDLPLLHDLEAREVSWRDLILFAGGLFLIYKSVREMHEKVEHAKAAAAGGPAPSGRRASFAQVVATIAVIDIVFSLDSVITAIGMVDADQVWVMVGGMVIAMAVMLGFSGPIARFVGRHPTVKVLALAFLILIGVMLVAEALGQHVNKGYIYFAMAFAVGIELINMQLRGPAKKAPEVAGP